MQRYSGNTSDFEFNAINTQRQATIGVQLNIPIYTGGLIQSRVRAALADDERARQQSQLDSTKLGYKVGVRINLEVLDAETQLVNTQRDLKRARYDFLLNGLRLQAAVGNLAESDLDAINRLLAR